MPYIRGEVKVAGIPTDGITVSVYDASRFGAPPVQGTAPPAGAADYTATTGGASGGSPGTWRVSVANYHDYYGTYLQNGIQFWDGPIPALDPLIPETVIQNLVADLAAKATDTLVAHLAGAETFTGLKTMAAGSKFQGLLDLSAAGALTDSANSSASAPGVGIGDKINLWGDGTSQYGFGIQGNRIVAYMPSAASFAVRTEAATGQKSSGTDAVTMGADGHLTATGLVTASGGVTGLPAPAVSSDAATKAYVDNSAGIPQRVRFTASGSWVVPAGVTLVDILCIGGGGGGGGGGSAAMIAGTSAQTGGGGGGGGSWTYRRSVAVAAGQTLTVTVGGVAAGGTAGAASSGATGNSGGAGGANADSYVQVGATFLLYAHGGGGGGPSTANSTATAGGGGYGYNLQGPMPSGAGMAGNGASSATYAEGSIGSVQGGAGGGTATVSLGGGGGGAGSPTTGTVAPGGNGASGTTAGLAGSNAAANSGCGGGGGGGGAPGGAGGAGGAGGSGYVEIQVVG